MCSSNSFFWTDCGHSTRETTCFSADNCRVEPHTSRLYAGTCLQCQCGATVPHPKATIQKLQIIVLREIEKEKKIWERFIDDVNAERIPVTRQQQQPASNSLPQITLTASPDPAPLSPAARSNPSFLSVEHSWRSAYNKERRKLSAAKEKIARLTEKQKEHDGILRSLNNRLLAQNTRYEMLKDQSKMDDKELAFLRARCARLEEERERGW